jgi:prepilin signal peptidase PulO-like enzyme (type II secretory pathway)
MCKSKVSPLSTIVEIGLGLLFVIAYLKIGISLPLLGMLVALTLLTGIVVYDLAHSMIPPVMLVPFVIVSGIFACMTISQTELLLQTIGIALGIAGFIAGIHVFSRGRAMGFADIPLAFGLSLLAGPMTFSGLIFSFWIGSVIGIYILAKTPPGSRMGIEVPFAPFLAAGFLLAYFTSWDAFTLVGNILGGYAGI